MTGGDGAAGGAGPGTPDGRGGAATNSISPQRTPPLDRTANDVMTCHRGGGGSTEHRSRGHTTRHRRQGRTVQGQFCPWNELTLTFCHVECERIF